MRMTRLLLLVALGVACEPAPYQSPNLSSEPPPVSSAQSPVVSVFTKT